MNTQAAEMSIQDAEKIKLFEMTLEQQVALYTEKLDILSALVRRSNAQGDYVLSRMRWLEDNPNAPQRHLMQGTVRQAQGQVRKTITEMEAVIRQIGEVFWEMTCSRIFRRDYQKTVLRVPNGLSLDGEKIDLWDWEFRPNDRLLPE
jgi:hypothetical protein